MHNAGIALDIVVASLAIVSGGGSTVNELDVEFRSGANVTIVSYGGESTLIDDSGADWLKWLPTVAPNPAPINMTFQPLSALMVDPVVASNLNDAIKEYLTAQPEVRARDACARGGCRVFGA